MSFRREALPKEYPRHFVPKDADLGDWKQLEPLFEDLENRHIESVETLERCLLDLSELMSVLYEERNVRYIRMTSQTDNPDYEKAYLHFVEKIDPQAKPRLFRIGERFLDSPARKKLPAERYAVLDRRIANEVALFRQENVPLEVEVEKLCQKYQKIVGAMTVEFDGREQTLQQMAKYLEETDRVTRKEAWWLIQRRRLQDRDEVNRLFNEMLEFRDQIARNADFSNYRDYAFRQRERFDYTPEDCFQFHSAVEEMMVPLNRDLQGERKEKLGVDPLRPWDLFVDAEGRPPLRPFEEAEELIKTSRKVFREVDPEFAVFYDRMSDLGLLDLESRKGKAPGGYQATLFERRLPFIFMNAVGRDSDVRTMLHEFGHALHTSLTRDEPLVEYRHAPLEFAEVASMSMDLIAGEFLKEFYGVEGRARSKRDHLESVVRIFPWIATVDAFQHWIYTNPKHTISKREDFWLDLHERFGGIESWEGYEDALRSQWHRQLHIFLDPFYYIEYGIAQLGALELWRRWLQDPDQAIDAYKKGLSLGGSRPLPELFAASGLRFDFGPQAVRPIVNELRSQLSL